MALYLFAQRRVIDDVDVLKNLHFHLVITYILTIFASWINV